MGRFSQFFDFSIGRHKHARRYRTTGQAACAAQRTANTMQCAYQERFCAQDQDEDILKKTLAQVLQTEELAQDTVIKLKIQEPCGPMRHAAM